MTIYDIDICGWYWLVFFHNSLWHLAPGNYICHVRCNFSMPWCKERKAFGKLALRLPAIRACNQERRHLWGWARWAGSQSQFQSNFWIADVLISVPPSPAKVSLVKGARNGEVPLKESQLFLSASKQGQPSARLQAWTETRFVATYAFPKPVLHRLGVTWCH